MTNKLWRLVFTVLLTAAAGVAGWYVADTFLKWLIAEGAPGWSALSPSQGAEWVRPVYRGVFGVSGIIFGVALGSFLFRRIELLGERIRDLSVKDKVALIIGVVVGLILSAVISLPILLTITLKPVGAVIAILIGIALTYLSIVATLSMKEEMRFYLPPQQVEEDAAPTERFKLLDTNVIIDGRIADIARAGFVEGPIYIPGFVLDELQHIADSSDSLKRARGRRGLDILNAMQKELKLVVRSYDRMAPGHEEVDARLVRLAKALDGAIVTNDFNLNKVAELQGVQVLNVNELANALKPVVLPGEEMEVAIVKEGKEPSQGVGYLDDGTMIVVEGGRRFMGETVEVLVSSVLQTQAGKMIFAHMREEEGDEYDRSVRTYTRSGPRRPVRR